MATGRTGPKQRPATRSPRHTPGTRWSPVRYISVPDLRSGCDVFARRSGWIVTIDVCRSTSCRLPKVEFMLSSFLGEISSRGYFARSAASPYRDSTGGG